MQTTIDDGIPAPPVRVTQKRVTPEMRALQPGQSVLVERVTAICLRDYGRRRRWKMVTKKDGSQNGSNLVRFWRVE